MGILPGKIICLRALVHEAVVESLQELRAWSASLPWAIPEPSVDASERFCRESQAAFIQRTSLPYLAFERSTGRFIASTSLHSIQWDVPRIELGFWCRRSAHRQGYTREAARALLELAFTGLAGRRVEAYTDELNLASRQLCVSVGMELEGVMRHERVDRSRTLRNTCVFAEVR
ncbi:MAG: GNAT family N-acetyltransferase, partial [Rubrivivax sp.]